MERAPPRSSSADAVPADGSEVELGFVSGVFGFRGELRVYLHNPESDLLREPRPVILVAPDGRRQAAVLSARPGAGNRIIGRIVGVTDEAQAQALRDHRIRIAKDALPSLESDEFYVWQLEGAEVLVAGQRVGEVRGVQHAGPTDILEVVTDEGEERFVPMLGEFVERVDPEAGQVHLLAGALEEG